MSGEFPTKEATTGGTMEALVTSDTNGITEGLTTMDTEDSMFPIPGTVTTDRSVTVTSR